MQCHCGANTSKQSATCKGTTLDYQRCTKCGRQDGYELTVKDQLVSKGESARLQYLSHEESMNTKPTNSVDDTVKAPVKVGYPRSTLLPRETGPDAVQTPASAPRPSRLFGARRT